MLSVLPGIWMYWGPMCYFLYFMCLHASLTFPSCLVDQCNFSPLRTWADSNIEPSAGCLTATGERRRCRTQNETWKILVLCPARTTRSPGQRAPSVFRCSSLVLPLVMLTATSVFPLSLSECLLAYLLLELFCWKEASQKFPKLKNFFLLFNFKLPVWRNKCSLKLLLCS